MWEQLFSVSGTEKSWLSKFSVSEKEYSWRFDDHPVPFSHSQTCSAFLQGNVGGYDEEDVGKERTHDVDTCSSSMVSTADKTAAKIGSVLLLEQNGRLLMTRRSGGLGLFPEVWVFPGGHIESGESLREAASREFEEEVGLHIEPSALELLCLWESCFPISWKEPLQAHHLVAFFFARDVLKRGVTMPQLQLEECDAYSWVSTDSALSIVLDRQYGSPEHIIGTRHLPEDLESGSSSHRCAGIPEVLDSKQEWKQIGDNLAMGHRFAMHVWLANQKKD
jgi:8-oxo-dGTP pyrophosphatase MutT (NUDIX family)